MRYGTLPSYEIALFRTEFGRTRTDWDEILQGDVGPRGTLPLLAPSAKRAQNGGEEKRILRIFFIVT